MDGGVAVVRVKPLSAELEASNDAVPGAPQPEGSTAAQHVTIDSASKRITAHGKTFTYPRHLLHEGAAAAPGHAAASPPPSQAVVYEKFMPQRVSDFVHRGRNCNVICYGQTGSGKTHTMFAPPGMMAKAGRKDFDLGPLLSPSTSASASPPPGAATTTASREVPAASSAAGSSDRADRVPENEKMKLADAEHLGLCPRGMIDIFRLVSEERASRGRRLLLTASIVELSAMEGNVDLLLKQKRAAADGAMFGRNTAASGVQLDRAAKPPQLQGMSQVTLEQEDDLRTIFAAIACRNTAGTGLNHSSSRTHCFVFLLLYELVGNFLSLTRFQFVDLAGSERLEDAHNGQANWRSGVLRVFEGMMTNYSLMMLSSCVRELVALKSPEKRKNFSLRLFMVDLVFLLEESLLRPEESGTLFVVCVSALGRNAQQSRFALEFGETFAMLGKNVASRGKMGTSSSGNDRSQQEDQEVLEVGGERVQDEVSLSSAGAGDVQEQVSAAGFSAAANSTAADPATTGKCAPRRASRAQHGNLFAIEGLRRKHEKIWNENKANLDLVDHGAKPARWASIRAALARDSRHILEVIEKLEAP